VIPSIVDTIIFISEGGISKVYTLEITVTVPTGMTEKDLSRPVILVRDFHTSKTEYEIYTFGEQIVVSPVSKPSRSKAKSSRVSNVTPSNIEKVLSKYSIYDYNFEFEPPNSLTLYVSNKDRPRVIGKDGRTIEEIERKLGLSITVSSFDELDEMEHVIEVYPIKNKVNMVFPQVCIGKDVIVTVNGTNLVQLTVGKSGEISVAKNSQVGKMLMQAYHKGATITALL
jgi:ATPase